MSTDQTSIGSGHTGWSSGRRGMLWVLLTAFPLGLTLPYFDSSSEAKTRQWYEEKVVSFRDLPDGCFTMELLEHLGSGVEKGVPAILGWTTSGVWCEKRLLLADMYRGSFAEINVGKPVISMKALQYKDTDKKEGLDPIVNIPWSVYPRQQGYLIVMLKRDASRYVSQILFVDSKFRIEGDPLQPLGRIGADPEHGEKVVSQGVFRAVPMNRGVFMVGSVRPHGERDGDDYWTAFAYYDRKEYKLFESSLRGRGTMKDLGNDFYSRDLMLMAAIEGEGEGDDTAFVLMMEEKPWIGRASQNGSAIEMFVDLADEYSVPRIESRVDLLTDSSTYYRDVYRTIENNAMPIGLFSWDGRLFLLAKDGASPNGRTEWRVREVSMADRRLEDKEISLPVFSEHVVLVPGSSMGDPFVAIQAGGVSLSRGGKLPDLLHRSARSAVILPGIWLDRPAGEPISKAQCLGIPIGDSAID